MSTIDLEIKENINYYGSSKYTYVYNDSEYLFKPKWLFNGKKEQVIFRVILLPLINTYHCFNWQ